MSSPLVPHGPLLVRFTNDNINTLKKKKKKFNSHLKRIAEGGEKGGVGWENLIGAHEQQNSGGLRNEVWKVCSVFGGQGLLDLPGGLSSKWTPRQSWAVQAFTTNYVALNLWRNEEIWVSQSAPDKWGQLIKKGESNSSCNLALNIQPQWNNEILSLPVNCLYCEVFPRWILAFPPQNAASKLSTSAG